MKKTLSRFWLPSLLPFLILATGYRVSLFPHDIPFFRKNFGSLLLPYGIKTRPGLDNTRWLSGSNFSTYVASNLLGLFTFKPKFRLLPGLSQFKPALSTFRCYELHTALVTFVTGSNPGFTLNRWLKVWTVFWLYQYYSDFPIRLSFWVVSF